MPMYDYFCKPCGEVFERLVSHAGRDEVRCKSCGEVADRNPVCRGVAVHTAGAGTRSPHQPAGRVDTSKLPVVGRDGKLYSASGQLLRG